MANRRVSLVVYAKTAEGWRRYPAALSKNGRVRPGYGLVDGVPTALPGCRYQLRRYEGKKTVYSPAGSTPADALNALRKAERRAEAVEAAGAAGAVLVEETGRVSLRSALKRHCDAAEGRGSNESAAVTKYAGEEFIAAVGKVYADEVKPEDVAAYLKLQRKRLAPRTVTNRFRLVKSFLRSAGVAVTDVMGRAPRFEQALPQVYEAAELAAFFASLQEQKHRVLFSTLLRTGLREREAMFLQWSDLSLPSKVLRVKGKPELDFAVKDAEEREIPIPDELAAELEAWREASFGKQFVFATSTDKPNGHLLRTLKRLVKAAGLHCGACTPCKESGECERWFLHKFRATYCTSLLRSGLDLRTVQSFMGHSDLESTMRYLRPAEGATVQSRISAVRFF